VLGTAEVCDLESQKLGHQCYFVRAAGSVGPVSFDWPSGSSQFASRSRVSLVLAAGKN